MGEINHTASRKPLMSARWQPLQPGDSIHIVAPAARTPDAWKELNRACELIRSAGFQPVFDPDIFADVAPLQSACNFANSDESRYQAFVRAVKGDSRVIWCFRGGYGSDRVAEQLFRHGIQPSGPPKLLVGFSDITVLHHYCRIHWGWSGLHAPVLHQLANNKVTQADISRTWAWLRGETATISLPLDKMNTTAETPGTIIGELTGGNLTVIQSMMGTPWEMPRDGIVFFEDVNEAPYRVARVLQQWLSGGWLRQAKAILLGDFMCGDTDSDKMDEVLADFAARLSCPVLRCRGIGHGENNHPLPIGRPAILSLVDKCVLSVSATI